MKSKNIVTPLRQQGAALLVSLVILLVLTVLALSSMQGTTLQERMVSSQRDAQIALEGAEFALQAAEAELAGPTLPTFDNSKGLYEEGEDLPAGFQTLGGILDPENWRAPRESASSIGHGGGSREAPMPTEEIDGQVVDLLAHNPRYFIKATPGVGSASSSGFGLGIGGAGDSVQQSGLSGTVYRVVAFSSGASGQAVRVIEAYVVRAD
ncbi:pilus assembly PilX family protein [Marinobacter vinifirmus]|nr:pilus assembly PilX N-terminal domain-containing protein [Marinobacter vinifirmus]